MNEFTPGEGWREVPAYTKPNGSPCLIEFDERGDDVRMWLPEEPVPPLPTADNTVIRPSWKAGIAHNYERLVLAGRAWWVVGVAPWHASPQALIEQITGFEVLAEPRGTDLPESLGEATPWWDAEMRRAAATTEAPVVGRDDIAASVDSALGEQGRQ